jgi:hypothetical protein
MKKNSDADYGFARARDLAFDAVMRLWEIRKKEGLTQAQLAASIGRDPGWVSRYLRGPGNWTLRTVGAFVVGLSGEIEISAHPLEEAISPARNYDAYEGYDCDPTPGMLALSHPRAPQPLRSEPNAASDLPDFLKRELKKSQMVAV